MLNKILIIFCLIIKTHSWTWKDYPSPRGPDYWKCGVTKPTYVCDPDGMLTDQQRKEIVDLVEDFKEKTKRPKSSNPCMREGLRLVVALSKYKIGLEDVSPGKTYLCTTDSKWTSKNTTACDADVHGIELNTNGFRYCHWIHWLLTLHKEEYEKLDYVEKSHLKKNYFDVLKDYIINLRMLYIQRFSIFDNDASNITLLEVHSSLQETKRKLSEIRQFSNNLFGVISIIISLIIGLVLLFLICQIRQIKNYLNQMNASKNETQLMTPMQPVEVVEKMREPEENEETTKPLLNL